MTTAERIRLLRRHGLENAVIAAVLGVNCDAIADHIADPSVEVTIPGGGGGGDVSGLLPLDGSRAMTGPLDFGDVSLRRFAAGGLEILGEQLLVDHPDGNTAGLSAIDGVGVGTEGYATYAWMYADGSFDSSTALGRTLLQASGDGQLRISDATGALGGLQFGEDVTLEHTAPGTLELDNTLSFKGAASDIYAGATLEWSDYWYGLMLKGRSGSGDAELYLVDPDDATRYINLWPGGIFIQNGTNQLSLSPSGVGGSSGGTSFSSAWADLGGGGGGGGGGSSLSLSDSSVGTGTSVTPNRISAEWDGLAYDKYASIVLDPYHHPDEGYSAWGYHSYGMLQVSRWNTDEDGATDIFLDLRGVGGGNWREFSIIQGGVLGWHPNADSPDVTLKRAGAGVLEIPQHGGGLKLWNDDGTVSKTVRLNHAGTALELV